MTHPSSTTTAATGHVSVDGWAAVTRADQPGFQDRHVPGSWSHPGSGQGGSISYHGWGYGG